MGRFPKTALISNFGHVGVTVVNQQNSCRSRSQNTSVDYACLCRSRIRCRIDWRPRRLHKDQTSEPNTIIKRSQLREGEITVFVGLSNMLEGEGM